MEGPELTAALCDYDHVRDLALGRVVPQGISLNVLAFPVEEIFWRFLKHREFDVSELSFAKYAAMRANGSADFTAIPVFPSRVFRHSSLYVRRDGPIREIADLAGRRVGIPEWAQTAAVYSRGFLVDQFGLDLTAIKWVQAGVNQPGRVEKVALSLPNGIELTRRPETSLNAMLLTGEVDAVLAARPPEAFTQGHPDIRRFFDDPVSIEAAYYRETRVFPIMHCVVIRDEVLARWPWAARNLFDAFEEARRRSIERVMDSTISLVPIPWGFEFAARGAALFGDDYFPYGVEHNRRTLESFLRHAHGQGVMCRALSVEDLFAPQTIGQHAV